MDKRELADLFRQRLNQVLAAHSEGKTALLRQSGIDLSPLAGLTNLETLDIAFNDITDLSPLAGLSNLTELFVGFNAITDLSPLAGLTTLETLDIQFNVKWLHFSGQFDEREPSNKVRSLQ